MSKIYPDDSSVNDILKEVLQRIKPDENMRKRLIVIYETIRDVIQQCLELNGLMNFEISLQGSVAKDTFLSNEADLDVFILFSPNNYSTEWINKEFVNITTKCLQNQGYNTIVKYAAHPYVTTHIDNIEVDVVPAFLIESPKNIISAVDRTPFHTQYVKTKLCEKCKDDVRLLKAFLKAWDLYGAEIRVQGFSGYLVELLIIKYGSFLNVLKASQSWRAYKTCIEVEEFYGDEKACRKRFKKDVLVVVDPVDFNRNAAAALSIKSYAYFKMLARLFLEKPAKEFFELGFEPSVSVNDVAKIIEERQKISDSCILALFFSVINRSPDVVWGQLKRVQRVLKNVLEKYGYRGMYIDSWVNDEMSKALTVVELLNCSGYELRKGPPAYSNESINFLMKNLDAVIGPWIDEKGSIMCIRKRKHDPVGILSKIVGTAMYTAVKLEEVKKITSVSDIQLINDPKFIIWFKKFLQRKHFDKIARILTK
uniref:CCA-adding enzyme n=1 Tax=Ignisphaera aggregans TaxID=334771 RepID=A0A7J2U0T2_9CREN